MHIQAFRQRHNLPATFGITTFEPKDFTGLARLDEAGMSLNQLRERVLQIIPPHVHLANLLNLIRTLTDTFEQELSAINDNIQLTEEQLGFAVAGFDDVLQAWCYAVIHAHAQKKPLPPFEMLYATWLEESLIVSQEVHVYQHHAETWHISTLHNRYGRVGLQVQMPNETLQVWDGVYTCPADGFMANLLSHIAQTITKRL
jgi:hypothetical protein